MLEGPTALAEALHAGVAVESVYIAAGTAVPEAGAATVRQLDPGVLRRVASTVTPQPVLAVAPTVDVPLARLRTASFVVVAVDVQDPGNAGTIIRSAVGAGADGVVLAGSSVDLHNPKTVRATAGALFRVPVAVVPDAMSVLDVIEARSFAAVASGGSSPDAVDLTGPVVLFVGNESHGLPAEVVDRCDARLTIPMAGPVESLNAAMAATALAFEVARQRRGPR